MKIHALTSDELGLLISTERDEQMMRAFFVEHRTYAEIGRQHDIGPEAARQALGRCCVRIVRAALREPPSD